MFKDNSLYQGTYTRGNGDYFRGSFKNGQPDLDSGKWYSSHGTAKAAVEEKASEAKDAAKEKANEAIDNAANDAKKALGLYNI